MDPERTRTPVSLFITRPIHQTETTTMFRFSDLAAAFVLVLAFAAVVLLGTGGMA
jgi:hypothetical protein